MPCHLIQVGSHLCPLTFHLVPSGQILSNALLYDQIPAKRMTVLSASAVLHPFSATKQMLKLRC